MRRHWLVLLLLALSTTCLTQCRVQYVPVEEAIVVEAVIDTVYITKEVPILTDDTFIKSSKVDFINKLGDNIGLNKIKEEKLQKQLTTIQDSITYLKNQKGDYTYLLNDLFEKESNLQIDINKVNYQIKIDREEVLELCKEFQPIEDSLLTALQSIQDSIDIIINQPGDHSSEVDNLLKKEALAQLIYKRIWYQHNLIRKIVPENDVNTLLFPKQKDPKSRYDGKPGNGGMGVNVTGISDRIKGGVAAPPKQEYESGRIAIDVWIDENGNVVKAEWNQKKSNIFKSGAQRDQCIAAVKRTKYTARPGAGTVKGTITFTFENK